MRLVKYHGIGNDFVLVNGFEEPLTSLNVSAFSRAVCDRHFGVGADGVIALVPGTTHPFRMRMFNPDGSESELCGNGLRCLAAFIRHERLLDRFEEPSEVRFVIETGAGDLWAAPLEPGREPSHEEVWTTDLGPYRTTPSSVGVVNAPPSLAADPPVWPVELDGLTFPSAVVSMGNPHWIIWAPDVDAVPLSTWGPRLEHSPHFPARTNVHFVQVVSEHHLRMRPWERGAGATQACGSGAAASAVASWITRQTGSTVRVDLPGGTLTATIQDGRVAITGPVVRVFEAEWPRPELP